MKKTLCIVSLVVLSGSFLLAQGDQKESAKPNFIVIFCDNLGYGDIEPFGSTLHRTPHLNRMAKEGRKFTHFCVTAGVCTPSRASIMTGCYSQRVSMHMNPRGTIMCCGRFRRMVCIRMKSRLQRCSKSRDTKPVWSGNGTWAIRLSFCPLDRASTGFWECRIRTT